MVSFYEQSYQFLLYERMGLSARLTLLINHALEFLEHYVSFDRYQKNCGELCMLEWQIVVLWFDLLKKNNHTDIDDGLKFKDGTVQIVGDLLPTFMESFWEQEGVRPDEFRVSVATKRTRLKSHLTEFLETVELS